MSFHRSFCIAFLAYAAMYTVVKGVAALDLMDALLIACAVFGVVRGGRA